MKKLVIITLVSLQAFIMIACIDKEPPNTPKPKGYFRIETPKATYQKWDSVLPFTFEYSRFAQFSIPKKEQNIYWMDLFYPQYNASLKMTLIPVKNNLRELIVNEEKMLMFHVENRKADDIIYSNVNDEKSRVYGQLYEIMGKGAATPLKFWLTDSTHYYVRATLYFNFTPNNDSLEPVIKYLKNDLLHLIDTWNWKK
ncbi:MAG: hypothetical protein RBS29_00120 [Bacteroidales bacterium]|jgi:gliding motility-associated lipoprotein GldD|nr:hypothetical protein [Bacteroidales bacterium]